MGKANLTIIYILVQLMTKPNQCLENKQDQLLESSSTGTSTSLVQLDKNQSVGQKLVKPSKNHSKVAVEMVGQPTINNLKKKFELLLVSTSQLSWVKPDR